jgi:3-oxoacyl-[acyl-carrier protein] reductase
MDLGLEGKVALVCGASSGMGRAVAEALAREGADLFLVARREEVLAALSGELRRSHGVKVLFGAGDLSRNDDASRLLKEEYEAFGRADILVANAGGPPPGSFDAVSTEEALRKGWELTFMSTVRMIRGVLGGMRERKWGRIVAITSVSVHEPIPGLALSNAYRPGLTGLLKTIASEVAADGVTVNSVCPGYTATERLTELAESVAAKESRTPEAIAAEWSASIPAGRLGAPEEIAAAVAFLCSGPASYITGVALPVDGGRLKGLLA